MLRLGHAASGGNEAPDLSRSEEAGEMSVSSKKSRFDRYSRIEWKISGLHGVSLAERDVRIRAAFAQRALNVQKGA